MDTSGLRLFTVDEYDEMLRVGILREGEPVELLGGRIVRKLPRSAEHMAATTRAFHALSQALPDGWHAVIENAVVLSGHDEPEPDGTVRRGVLRDYDHRKAAAEDIALLIEVSATSVDIDRGVKLRAYAAAGVPVYWIVNLNSRCVEVYTAPRGAEGLDYAHREERGEAAHVDVVIDGRVIGQIPVAAILPAPPVG